MCCGLYFPRPYRAWALEPFYPGLRLSREGLHQNKAKPKPGGNVGCVLRRCWDLQCPVAGPFHDTSPITWASPLQISTLVGSQPSQSLILSWKDHTCWQLDTSGRLWSQSS